MSFFDEADLDKKAAQDEEEFNSEDWTPELGEELNAIVLSNKVVDTKRGKKLVVVIRNAGEGTSGGIEAGKSGNLWCPAVLTRKMLEETPAVGKGIKVRFEGKVTPEKGGNPYFAIPERGATYPLNWLFGAYGAVTGETSWWLMQLKQYSHHVIAAICMHAYLRSRDLPRMAAVVGGLAWMASAPSSAAISARRVAPRVEVAEQPIMAGVLLAWHSSTAVREISVNSSISMA